MKTRTRDAVTAAITVVPSCKGQNPERELRSYPDKGRSGYTYCLRCKGVGIDILELVFLALDLDGTLGGADRRVDGDDSVLDVDNFLGRELRGEGQGKNRM